MSAHDAPPERVMVLTMPSLEARCANTGDLRPWHEALAAVQQVVPGAASMRVGWCAMRARGPARYYGDEIAAAAAVIECAKRIADSPETVSLGVASGRFAARQAALAPSHTPGVHEPLPGVRIVSPEDTSAFLSPLPIVRAADEQLASVLFGLGVRTLGAFAALPETAVLQRFGQSGVIAHRRARGLGELRAPEVSPAAPVHDFSIAFSFEPPLEGVDQLAFACGAYAERFVRGLGGHGLVCTELLVELTDDIGVRRERQWSHPTNFTATDVVNRVRWQAAGVSSDSAAHRVQDARGGAGITAVRISAARTASAAAHEPGLWSTAPDEQVHHQLTRVQSLVGHEHVGTGVLTGGRSSPSRQTLLPWGTAAKPDPTRARDGPWPGSITGATPNTVFDEPVRVALKSADGAMIGIDTEDLLTSSPATLQLGREPAGTVRAWSAPWPLRERWWSETDSTGPPRTVHRMQVLLANGDAWLLRLEDKNIWLAEGRYS